MQTLDVRGLSCPIPVLELKKELEKSISELRVLADCGTATENIKRFTQNNNFKVSSNELDDGSVEFVINKI